jgi:hypothetical protein
MCPAPEILMNFGRRVIPSRFRPLGYLSHLAMSRSGGRVMRGPFASMRYSGRSVGSAMVPKVLGIYERELASAVEEAIHWGPGLVVDAGAADGYCAVGLALRLPQARVIGYEMEPAGQKALTTMAELNGVRGRVEVRGKCEPDDLQTDIASAARPLVVCDVEGYEELLLAPVAVPALRRAAVLVETHEFAHRGIAKILEERFAPTHRIRTIWQEPRSADEFPWRTLYTRCLPQRYRDWTVSEWRLERMCWL